MYLLSISFFVPISIFRASENPAAVLGGLRGATKGASCQGSEWPLPFETIKLPQHYVSYKDFECDLMVAIATCHTGFGLV